MTPDQIDFRRATWTLPDVENKAKNVVQPLTPKMLELIRDALGNRATGLRLQHDRRRQTS